MKVVRVDPAAFDDSELAEGAALLRAGRLVAFPTETVYGLGANASDAAAVARIFAAKGRPQDNPLIVHIASAADLPRVVARVPPAAAALAERFWPGPLTLVLRRRSPLHSSSSSSSKKEAEAGEGDGAMELADAVSAGLPSVAVRVPAHPVARRLIALAGVPVAAPSANPSGRPSPTSAAHVLRDYASSSSAATAEEEEEEEKIAMVIDGGPCAFGVESTVVDVECAAAGGRPLVLRPGGLTLEALRAVVPAMGVYARGVHGAALAEKPATPGLKYRHYSPTAPVVLFDPAGASESPTAIAAAGSDGSYDSDELRAAAGAAVAEWLRRLAGSAVGILRTHTTDRDAWTYDIHAAGHVDAAIATDAATAAAVVVAAEREEGSVRVVNVGDERTDLAGVERGLFDALRCLDAPGVAAILVEGVGERAEGLAIMNRLRKAASTTVDVSPAALLSRTAAPLHQQQQQPAVTPTGEFHMPP